MGSRIAGWKSNGKRIWAYGDRQSRHRTIQEHVYHSLADQADCLGIAHYQFVYTLTSGTNTPAQFIGDTMNTVTTETSGQLSLTKSPTTTYCAPGFLARLLAWLVSEEASLTPGARYFLRSQGLRGQSDHAYYYWRTSKDSSATTPAEPLLPSSWRWMNLGMMQSGRCLTAKIGAYPRTGNECSLSEVLEASVDPKYFLSSETTRKLVDRHFNRI